MVTGSWEMLGLIDGGAGAWVPPPAVHATARRTRPNSADRALDRSLMTLPFLPTKQPQTIPVLARVRSYDDPPQSPGSGEQPILSRSKGHGHRPEDGRILTEGGHPDAGTEPRESP